MGMDILDVNSVASTVSSYNIGTSTQPASDQEAIGVAMLGKVIETNQDMSLKLIQSMERSVTPNLGNNIDMYL